jgi:hypothetical protein
MHPQAVLSTTVLDAIAENRIIKGLTAWRGWGMERPKTTGFVGGLLRRRPIESIKRNCRLGPSREAVDTIIP